MRKKLLLLPALLCAPGCLLWALSPRPVLLANDVPDADGGIEVEDGLVPMGEAPDSADPYAQFSDDQLNTLREVLDLVNAARSEAGVSPLELNAALCGAAQVRAQECTQGLSHTRPDGSSYKTAITQAGVSSGYTGENAATGHSSAQQVVDSWLRSEGHRKNILSENFTQLGVGFAPNTSGRYKGYAWVQLFVQ